jgi:peptide/nickel transport system permease protein
MNLDLMENTHDAEAVLSRKATDWLLILGAVIVSVSCFLMIFGPYIGPYDPTLTTIDVAVPPPALTEIPGLFVDWIGGRMEAPPHWMGTDASGYDIFSRVIAAPRTDLVIALSANAISLCVGLFLGLVAGYYRNWATELLMRV